MGLSAKAAGARVLGFSIVAAGLCAIVALLQNRFHFSLLYPIAFGLAVCSIGIGLYSLPFRLYPNAVAYVCRLTGCFATLDQHSSDSDAIILTVLVGFGFAFLLKLPNDLLTQTLKDKKLTYGNSMFFFVRFTGCSVGITISNTVFVMRWMKLLPIGSGVDAHAVDWKALHEIEDIRLRSLF